MTRSVRSLAASLALSLLAAAPVTPVVVRVDGATGIPAETCDEALGRVPEPKPEPKVEPEVPAEPRPAPEEPPDLSALPKVKVGGASFDRASMPGGDPAAVPPPPIEGPPEALAALAAAMRKGEQGRLRISVFGASHTEGDFFTGHLRRLLQRRYGDLGHGFVMPAAIVRGYRGQDVNLCRSDDWFSDWAGRRGGRDDGLLGLMGASVSSGDPGQFGWVETTRSNPEGQRASRYDLFTLGQPGGGSLAVTIDAAPPVTLATAADAPRMQVHRFEVPDGGHRFRIAPVGDGEVRVFGLSVEREGTGVLVDALGIRGRTAKSMLSWNREMAAQGLAVLDPDVVVLAYGVNEAVATKYELDDYRTDLHAVLDEARAAAPDAACLLIGPTDMAKKVGTDTYAIWSRIEGVSQVQREVAQEHGCAFWDWQKAMGGPGSIVGWRLQADPLAARDLIHLAPKGYVLSAEKLLAALDGLPAQR